MENICTNMKWGECKNLIEADYLRLNKRKGGKLGYLITNHSFKITFWFRIGSFLKGKGGLYKLLLFFVSIIYKHNQYKTGIQLPFGTPICGGLLFTHFGTIIIHYEAQIGKNCTIFQGVTIGSMRGRGVPKIGDNCVLFSGARIIGDITLGDNVVVGAGSVVVKDVPNNSTVAGVPSKILSQNGEQISKLYIS